MNSLLRLACSAMAMVPALGAFGQDGEQEAPAETQGFVVCWAHTVPTYYSSKTTYRHSNSSGTSDLREGIEHTNSRRMLSKQFPATKGELEDWNVLWKQHLGGTAKFVSESMDLHAYAKYSWRGINADFYWEQEAEYEIDQAHCVWRETRIRAKIDATKQMRERMAHISSRPQPYGVEGPVYNCDHDLI